MSGPALSHPSIWGAHHLIALQDVDVTQGLPMQTTFQITPIRGTTKHQLYANVLLIAFFLNVAHSVTLIS